MSTKVKFQYGCPANGGHSQLKLVMQLVGASDWVSLYGFGGRNAPLSKKQKHYDKQKFFSVQNEENYLKDKFSTSFSTQNLRIAFIADSEYPSKGSVREAYCFLTRTWTTLENVKLALYRHHRDIYETASQIGYRLRLWVPLYGNPQGVNFYTQKADVTSALLELISQFQTWKLANKSKMPQPTAQIYGNPNTIHDISERDVKKFAWLDTSNMLPKYHHSQKVVAQYQHLINAHQNFEELISNI